MPSREQMQDLPGGDLVAKGLEDLRRGETTVETLLVLVGAPRLRALGSHLPGPRTVEHPEHELYFRLAETKGDAAHSQYNALIRRLVSFERAVVCVQ